MGNDRYCKKCGSKLIKKETNEYNKKTGKINYVLVCPSGICGHTGIGHEWKEKLSFIEKINYQCVCKNCGIGIKGW